MNAGIDPQIATHLEWIGYVQPTGLVVSAPALVRAGAILDLRDAEGQRLLRACCEEREFDTRGGPAPWLPDFRAFAEAVLSWSFAQWGYAGTPEAEIPDELQVALPEFGETLRPDFAVRELEPQKDAAPWQLLVRVVAPGEELDKVVRGGGGLEASAHGRMERLLRQTGVAAGLLFNGCTLRLISAPRGESSGWMDFRVADMVLAAGRPICTALRLLLGQPRLLALPRPQRLAALLDDSRKYQNEVSERLAEQVLHALYEFLRGFQAAHDASGQELLHEQLRDEPNVVYHALLTVVLRLVFLLYAEERDMLSEDGVYVRSYSLAGLHERLRENAALFPDTMDQRYGAWAQLLMLFRMVHDGARFGTTKLPERHGVLFDPDRFPFLEGRSPVGGRQMGERLEPPLVPDGVVYRALEKLLLLDGERISYRALDVEQIGSVYETMMGFRIKRAEGRSVAIRSQKRNGAPTTVDLDALLAEEPAKRKKRLESDADRIVSETVSKGVKNASTLESLHAALVAIADLQATPDLVPPGAMILQPSEERRRSGSHYTPRSLTEPIVRTTLGPILMRLRSDDSIPPKPEQILELKVCDPAMGSGAFLVETCRQLGDALIEAWDIHGGRPELPPDEDEVVHARRIVAKQCLYGVDRNPVAVDLAKVSLWLVTLAREHPLTFVDHALRHGDSLVGLSLQQIEALRWDDKGRAFDALRVSDHLARVTTLRERVRLADDAVADADLRDWWGEAQGEIDMVKLYGDLVIAAYFSGANSRERETKRALFVDAVLNSTAEQYRGWLEQLREGERPLVPFHWELEFPEVFERRPSGFDAIVGNPPFMGGRRIRAGLGDEYFDWLSTLTCGASGNADLVAHFFRRAFELVGEGGTFGLIATNTIAQGDSRGTGLRWICTHGGEVFAVRRRVKWPGSAAVVVSVVHVMKGQYSGTRLIDDRLVAVITAFLFHRGGHDDPARLFENAGKIFQGSIVLGRGFTFDDTDTKGVAGTLAEMSRLIEKDASNADVIFPYIGGDEVNTSPSHSHHRYVINFSDFPLKRADVGVNWRNGSDEMRSEWLRAGVVPVDYPGQVASDWPDVLAILEERVKPERTRRNERGEYVLRDPLPVRWWQYADKRPALARAISELSRVLVISQVTQQVAFAFLPSGMVYSHRLYVLADGRSAAIAVLQSDIHDVWARFLGSSLEERFMYAAVDCFETFPFPEGWERHPDLEAVGREYYEFRAALMLRNNEGLTKTYNRFHDPEWRDRDILRFRELHGAMDRAVLDAYGWSDIPTECGFLLDYEDEGEDGGRRKKPWRYRWPDEVRDEVLARLLELNAKRAAAEARAGVGAVKKKKTSPIEAVTGKPSPNSASQEGLF
jgi:hypothetical protein